MKTNLLKLLFLAAAGLALAVCSLAAAPGDLDPSFGTQGTVQVSGGGGDFSGIALQTDGKIVVSSAGAVRRFLTNGQTDTSFGNGGVTPPWGLINSNSSPVAIQSDGKIITAGRSNIVRFTQTGSVDISFGSNGVVGVNFGLSGPIPSCAITALSIQPDDKIVIAGYADHAIAIARYLPNGTLDPSFGVGGIVTETFGDSATAQMTYGILYCLAIQTDGKIVVGGAIGIWNDFPCAVARFNSNGSHDVTFAGGRFVLTHTLPPARALTVDKLGNVIVGVGSRVQRYTKTGMLDASFGGGTVSLQVYNNNDLTLYDVKAQADGKVIVAGFLYSNSLYRFTVARFNTDGTPDSNHGENGAVITDFGSTAMATALAIQADGKIIASGNAGSAKTTLAMARYQVGVSPLVFIPGIAGSKLIGGGQTGSGQNGNGYYLWPTVAPADINLLNLRSPTRATDVQAVDIISDYGELGFDYALATAYKPFIKHITGHDTGELDLPPFALQEDRSRLTSDYMLTRTYDATTNRKPLFFSFPYDWRQDNATHIDTLHAYIAKIRQLHGDAKVNVVAHSMGGLLLRRYILKYPQDIDRVVTFGSPFLGAPKAIYRMLTGYFYDSPVDWITRPDMQLTLATLPGGHQLLPSARYLTSGGSPAFNEERWDINNDGSNVQSYNADQVVQMLNSQTAKLEAETPYGAYPDVPYNVNTVFHGYANANGQQDDWRTDSSGIKYLHLYGQQEKDETTVRVTAYEEPNPYLPGTTQAYLFQPVHKFREAYGKGDGVVPVLSASLASLWAPGAVAKAIVGANDSVEHTKLTGNATALDLMDQFLGGKTIDSEPVQATRGTTDAAIAGAAGAQHINVTGVGYVRVMDAAGNENTRLSDIAARRLSGVNIRYGGTQPYVDIDALASTNLVIQGVGTSQTVDIKILQASGATGGRLAATSQVGTPTSLRRFRFDPGIHAWQAILSSGGGASEAGEPVVSLDTQDSGDFSAGQQVPVTFTSGHGPVDVTAPLLGTNLSSSTDGRIIVSLTARDDPSATPIIRYILNDGPVQTYNAPLIFEPNTSAVLKAFAEDSMGNASGLVTTAVRPVLSTRGDAGAVMLQWPVAEAYILEETDDLFGGTWTRSAATVTNNGFQESATVLVSTSEQKFFRLRSQAVTK